MMACVSRDLGVFVANNGLYAALIAKLEQLCKSLIPDGREAPNK